MRETWSGGDGCVEVPDDGEEEDEGHGGEDEGEVEPAGAGVGDEVSEGEPPEDERAEVAERGGGDEGVGGVLRVRVHERVVDRVRRIEHDDHLQDEEETRAETRDPTERADDAVREEEGEDDCRVGRRAWVHVGGGAAVAAAGKRALYAMTVP